MTSLQMRRLVPAVALAALALAVVDWTIGASPWIAVAVLAAGAVALGAYVLLRSRLRATSDQMASQIDADAGLNGELRSAHWFEEQTDRDDWAAFHVDRAAERAKGVNWSGLYAIAPSHRSWVAAAAMAVAVLAFAVRIPARQMAPAPEPGLFAEGQPGAALPADLQEKLAKLFAQFDQAEARRDDKAVEASLADLKDLLAKLDPAMQKQLQDLLAKRMADAKERADAAPWDKDERADRAENSAGGLPEDVRWALDNEAQRMAQADPDRKTPNNNNQSASTQSGEMGMGSPQAQMENATAPAPSLVRESASDPGGKMMMSGGGPMGGDSRPGAGGNSPESKGAADALLMAQALRKELVEANADALGENVDKEDLRRKTEQGKSSLGFSRVAPPAAYEPSRATAPPPVPEARRPLLHAYFIRK